MVGFCELKQEQNFPWKDNTF